MESVRLDGRALPCPLRDHRGHHLRAGLQPQIDDRPGRACDPSIERPGIGLSRRGRTPPRRRGTAVPEFRERRHHRCEGSQDHRHGPDAAGDPHGPADVAAVPARHDPTAVPGDDQAARRTGAGTPATIGLLPDRRTDDVVPYHRPALCRAAPGVRDHQGGGGHRTAPSGRDSGLPAHRYGVRRHRARNTSHADAGRQGRSAELSGLPWAGGARAARSRTPSRRGALRRCRAVGYRLRIGLCGLADDERRWRRRQRVRWWRRRRMRRLQLKGGQRLARTTNGAPPIVLQNALQNPTLLSWRSLMPRAVERKEHPLSMRLPETDIAIIDRAATLRGRSRTDFVRDAAVRAAEDVLMETAPIRMSPAGFKAFMAALSGPATPAPEMIALFQRAAPWETKALSSEVDPGSRKKKTIKAKR